MTAPKKSEKPSDWFNPNTGQPVTAPNVVHKAEGEQPKS